MSHCHQAFTVGCPSGAEQLLKVSLTVGAGMCRPFRTMEADTNFHVWSCISISQWSWTRAASVSASLVVMVTIPGVVSGRRSVMVIGAGHVC